WDEKSAGARIRERLSPLYDLVDERVVMSLRFQEQVRAGVDEEVAADGITDCVDPLRLHVEGLHAISADHLVFEVAANRARLLETCDVCAAVIGISRIGAFKVDC